MIISCHIPKTAGVSFATALHEAYGEGFLWDRSHETLIAAMYNENRFPLESVPVRWLNRYRPPCLRGVSCIHGHFPLRKHHLQACDRNNVFIVWLRDPLPWRISLYYYWKQFYPDPTDKYLNRIFDANWSLERFCLDRTFDNYQSRYLAWFPRSRIDFIGVVENYASDLDYLSQRILRREIVEHRLNQTKKPDDFRGGDFGGEFLRRFEANNQVDYRNYRDARRMSDARASKSAMNDNGSWPVAAGRASRAIAA